MAFAVHVVVITCPVNCLGLNRHYLKTGEVFVLWIFVTSRHLGGVFSPLRLSELPGAFGASPSARRRSRPCSPLLQPVPGLFCVPDSCAQLRPLRVQAAYKGFRPRGADPGAGPGASFTRAHGNGANAAPSALENQAPRVAFIRSAC